MTFDPDTLAETYRQGYDNCAKCIGGTLQVEVADCPNGSPLTGVAGVRAGEIGFRRNYEFTLEVKKNE